MTPIFTPSDDAPSFFYDCSHVGVLFLPRQQPHRLSHVAPEGLDLAPGQDVLQPDVGDGAVVELDGAAGQGQGGHLDAGHPEVRHGADTLRVWLWEGNVVRDEVLEGSVSFNTEVVEAELVVGRDGQGEETPLAEILLLHHRSIDNMLLDTAITMVDGDDMSSSRAAGTAFQKGHQTLDCRHVVLVRRRERLKWRL